MEKKNRLFDWLVGNVLPEDVSIDFINKPFDNKLLELSWQSPNDKKNNLIEFLMNPNKLDRIELEDAH